MTTRRTRIRVDFSNTLMYNVFKVFGIGGSLPYTSFFWGDVMRHLPICIPEGKPPRGGMWKRKGKGNEPYG